MASGALVRFASCSCGFDVSIRVLLSIATERLLLIRIRQEKFEASTYRIPKSRKPFDTSETLLIAREDSVSFRIDRILCDNHVIDLLRVSNS